MGSGCHFGIMQLPSMMKGDALRSKVKKTPSPIQWLITWVVCLYHPGKWHARFSKALPMPLLLVVGQHHGTTGCACPGGSTGCWRMVSLVLDGDVAVWGRVRGRSREGGRERWSGDGSSNSECLAQE